MKSKGECSASIRERVIKAGDIQTERYKNLEGMYCNAQMSSKQLREICVINQAGESLLKRSMEKLNLSLMIAFESEPRCRSCGQ